MTKPVLSKDGSEDTAAVAPKMRMATVLPLMVFVGLAILLGYGLTRDPREIPSPLLGKEVPVFELPAVQGRTLGLTTADLKGQVSLVNVFASWCVACRQEHPLLLGINESGAVPVHGLNYKDAPADAAAWLDELGDPYTRTGADIDGGVGIDWGVYGVPETFVIDKRGTIRYKHIGPVSMEDVERILRPLVRRLQEEPA